MKTAARLGWIIVLGIYGVVATGVDFVVWLTDKRRRERGKYE